MEKGGVLLKVLGVIYMVLNYFVFQIYYSGIKRNKQFLKLENFSFSVYISHDPRIRMQLSYQECHVMSFQTPLNTWEDHWFTS